MFRVLAMLLLLAAVLQGNSRAALADEPREILSAMQAAAGKLDGYSLTQLKRERFGEQVSPAETMVVKYRKGRVYLHILSGPREGAEALYVPGWNDNKVRIHKGSFPDITLNLDPHSSLLMDGQHHPIEHAGLSHVVSALLANVAKAEAAGGEAQMRLLPPTEVQGRAADVIEMVTPQQFARYVVQKGDDVWGLAQRLQVDAYVLVHANGLKRVGSLSPGTVLQVPAYYGSRTVVAVDRKSHLPSRLEVYDGKGRLYELYEWSRLEQSPLTDQDFNPDNPSYHF